MKKTIAVCVLFCGLGFAGRAEAAPKLAKVATAAVTAPVVHPKRTLKQIAGSVLFAAEPAVDVAAMGLQGLDIAASAELKHNPFHYGFLAARKADASVEKAEDFLFGMHN